MKWLLLTSWNPIRKWGYDLTGCRKRRQKLLQRQSFRIASKPSKRKRKLYNKEAKQDWGFSNMESTSHCNWEAQLSVFWQISQHTQLGERRPKHKLALAIEASTRNLLCHPRLTFLRSILSQWKKIRRSTKKLKSSWSYIGSAKTVEKQTPTNKTTRIN